MSYPTSEYIDNLPVKSIVEAREHFECGALTATALLEYCVALSQSKPEFNVFITKTFDLAHKQAEISDARLATGITTPLNGMPIA
ncbi:MAG: hypothetical protein HRT83_05790, partial [Hyphomicrobiaceae bacterium]|nr:hypothetical protein [Hyphomicrobiaceae bacterium]